MKGPHLPICHLQSCTIFITNEKKKTKLGSLQPWKAEASQETSVSERRGQDLGCEAASQAQLICLNPKKAPPPTPGIRGVLDFSLTSTTP